MSRTQTQTADGYSRFLAEARAVVTRPETYGDNMLARRVAWATLKGARGQSCNQTVLQQMRGGRLHA